MKIRKPEMLFLIPARDGSKGVPQKNFRPIAGRPLIAYTIEAARAVADDAHICISTDSDEVMACAEQMGLHVPFRRPAELATDTASSEDVIRHALHWYGEQGRTFDWVVLLQPTSPLRTGHHIQEALGLIDDRTDMVVSASITDANPYYVLFEKGEDGYLLPSKKGTFKRRQDCPEVYQLNGAIYIIRVSKFLTDGLASIVRKTPYLMDRTSSLDIDDETDWQIAEMFLQRKKTQ